MDFTKVRILSIVHALYMFMVMHVVIVPKAYFFSYDLFSIAVKLPVYLCFISYGLVWDTMSGSVSMLHFINVRTSFS